MYFVGKNVVIVECWDIDYGSLVLCNFFLTGGQKIGII